MAEYKAVIVWNRDGAVFTDNRYSRGHRWLFDGGIEVPASASPHVVPLPFSIAEAVDPEEEFVASLSSCHMLWFLHLAGRRGFVVDSYRDEATGTMSKDETGKQWISQVMLRPEVRFVGDRRPSLEEIRAMHEAAHEECFLARSVKSKVLCAPVMPPA